MGTFERSKRNMIKGRRVIFTNADGKKSKGRFIKRSKTPGLALVAFDDGMEAEVARTGLRLVSGGKKIVKSVWVK
jgi:hypothetical protein